MLLSSVPISAIRAFEAAARTGSFRDAANELRLTPSAVSHAIRKLESTMSTTLFERSARSVRLTPAGENLMRHAGAAFTRAGSRMPARPYDLPHKVRRSEWAAFPDSSSLSD